jgi:hypothetical protein
MSSSASPRERRRRGSQDIFSMSQVQGTEKDGGNSIIATPAASKITASEEAADGEASDGMALRDAKRARTAHPPLYITPVIVRVCGALRKKEGGRPWRCVCDTCPEAFFWSFSKGYSHGLTCVGAVSHNSQKENPINYTLDAPEVPASSVEQGQNVLDDDEVKSAPRRTKDVVDSRTADNAAVSTENNHVATVEETLKSQGDFWELEEASRIKARG